MLIGSLAMFGIARFNAEVSPHSDRQTLADQAVILPGKNRPMTERFDAHDLSLPARTMLSSVCAGLGTSVKRSSRNDDHMASRLYSNNVPEILPG